MLEDCLDSKELAKRPSPTSHGISASAARKTSLDWPVLLSVENIELLTGSAESGNSDADINERTECAN